MIEKTSAIYIFIDEMLTKIYPNKSKKRNMSDAELITTVFVSAIYFAIHHRKQ